MDQLGGIIWETTKYLCGCAKQEAKFVYDLEENLQLLESKRKNIENIKKDIEAQIEEAEKTTEMIRSHQVISWLQDVQGTQKKMKDIQDQGAQEMENRCLSKCCPKDFKSSYKLGRDAAQMLKKADDLTTDGQRFGKDIPITQKLPHKPIDQIPLDETIGLGLIFDKVWSSIEAKKVGVIGLYGTGGVGKTTLLKKINNELGKRKPDYFVMWVVVSKELNLDRIMDNIRKSVGIGENTWNSCNNQEEKASKIFGVLKEKKFILLLDDMWHRLDLNMVGVPHPKDTNFESKVLFTTRLEDVCAKMQTQKSFKVEFLKEKEALELFKMKVGEETLNSDPRIKDLAKGMAIECKGLPLALVVVGSAMAGVKSVEAWERSKRNLTSSSWTTLDLEKKVLSILKFSYDQLPDAIHKNCFLYCALYPEDYEIRVSDLIDKWMGEGFLCKDMIKSIHDMRIEGHSVIAKLKLCCLLESVEDDIFVTRSVKMHDMIRDMALWLTCDQVEKKVLGQGDARALSHDDVEKWKNVERISIIGGEEWHLPSVDCPNLKTLLLRGCEINGLHNIKCMRRLKCLELDANNRYEPGEIFDLVLLEYLSLRLCGPRFPKELKMLKELKILNLCMEDDEIACIPLEVIPSLQELRVLRFTCLQAEEGSEEEAEFLEELESLPKIEEINVEIKTENGLNKLLYSSKLQSCTSALRLSYIDTPIKMRQLLASMPKMKQLRQFGMIFLSRVEEDSCFYEIHHLNMLQSVVIGECNSITHVTWLKYAPFLQVLFIAECESLEEVIKEEEGITKDEKSGESSKDSTLSSLVELYLADLPKLKSIHKTVLSFSSLRSIAIDECPNLMKLPFDSNSATHKLRLIRGEEYWWNNLEWDDPAAQHKFQSKFRTDLVDTSDEEYDARGKRFGLDMVAYAGLDFISFPLD